MFVVVVARENISDIILKNATELTLLSRISVGNGSNYSRSRGSLIAY